MLCAATDRACAGLNEHRHSPAPPPMSQQEQLENLAGLQQHLAQQGLAHICLPSFGLVVVTFSFVTLPCLCCVP
jgi:hypothetical protein